MTRHRPRDLAMGRVHAAAGATLLLAQLVLVAPVGYLLLLTVAAWRALWLGQGRTAVPSHPVHRFAILVPAHDEEVLIGSTIARLQELDYPQGLVSVHVVADNCTDRTAAIASRAGVQVHERTAPDQPGKGPALAWLVERLVEAGEPFDAVAVIDADTLVDPRFLRVADARLTRGDRVIQGRYAVRDPGASWSVGLRFAAFAVRHHLRPLARASLGTSVGLFGNGMVLAADVIRSRSFSAHLTEDIELHLELVLAGERVTYAPDAVVEAEMPATLDAARTQHERWERGRLQMAKRFLPDLLRSRGGDRARRARQLDAAADLLLPPFTLLAAGTVGAVLLSRVLGARRRTRLSRANERLGLALVGSQGAYVLSGLRMADAPWSVYRSLLGAPLLIAWKLQTLLGSILEPGDGSWVRTRRNATPASPEPRLPVRRVPVPLLGVPLDDVTMAEAVERCLALVDEGRATGRSHQVVTVNVDFLVNARDDPALHAILQGADLALADGMPVVWAARLLRTPLQERVAGADLVPLLAAAVGATGKVLYLTGGAPGVAEAAAADLSARHPGGRVIGADLPFFDDVERIDPGVLHAIRTAAPDILCVALGHPKQERWIEAHRATLGVPLLIGVGGSLDFIVGTKRRAPPWLQRSGLEWTHRLATEPGRLFRRYATDLARFPPLVVGELRAALPARSDRTGLVVDGGRVRLLGGFDLAVDVVPDAVSAMLERRVDLPVDLSLCARLDRMTLASLITLSRRARHGGGRIVLCGLSPRVAQDLRRSGFASAFAVADGSSTPTSG